jgi:predicted HTH domain antitoxin
MQINIMAIDGIKQIRVKKLIPLFEQGEISIEQLAKRLNLTIYELLKILKQKKVLIGSNLSEKQEELAQLKKRLNLSKTS